MHRWTTQDERLASFYASFVGPRDLCFDIGANYGNRTKVFLHLGARVVAVEPQAACCRVLESQYAADARVKIIRAAVGEEEGCGELRIADAHVLSSMSQDWIDAVSRSGRFSGTRWGDTERVAVTTVDALSKRFGHPDFVKIDVEGYEPNVLRGMTALPTHVSFELTLPECLEEALFCIDYLDGLGSPAFNYSLGEAMGLVLDEWIDGHALKHLLRARKEPTFGDVLAAAR